MSRTGLVIYAALNLVIEGCLEGYIKSGNKFLESLVVDMDQWFPALCMFEPIIARLFAGRDMSYI